MTPTTNDPENPNNENHVPRKSGGKFYWIYLVIFILILLTSTLLQNKTTKEITWQQFENDILSTKSVDKINVINNEKAKVYIKPSLANNPAFKTNNMGWKTISNGLYWNWNF